MPRKKPVELYQNVDIQLPIVKELPEQAHVTRRVDITLSREGGQALKMIVEALRREQEAKNPRLANIPRFDIRTSDVARWVFDDLYRQFTATNGHTDIVDNDSSAG